MTESEKEKLKHRATFFNGIGLVFFAAVSFGSAFRILHSDWSYNFLRFAVLVIVGLVVAVLCHQVGQALLGKLDDRQSPTPPPSPPRT